MSPNNTSTISSVSWFTEIDRHILFLPAYYFQIKPKKHHGSKKQVFFRFKVTFCTFCSVTLLESYSIFCCVIVTITSVWVLLESSRCKIYHAAFCCFVLGSTGILHYSCVDWKYAPQVQMDISILRNRAIYKTKVFGVMKWCYCCLVMLLLFCLVLIIQTAFLKIVLY